MLPIFDNYLKIKDLDKYEKDRIKFITDSE